MESAFKEMIVLMDAQQQVLARKYMQDRALRCTALLGEAQAVARRLYAEASCADSAGRHAVRLGLGVAL